MQLTRNKVALLCLILINLFTCSYAKQIYLKNNKLYDSKNRQITLHGTNVVVKVPPYMPTIDNYNSLWSFGPQDIQNLKDNGFNAIRLGVMWAGVEPDKNGFNQTYLAKMVQIVNNAGKAGIYTLVQFHQDLLSQTFCGDGVPIWLVWQLGGYKSFPFPLKKKMDPKNFTCNLPWSQYYFAYDVGRGFDNLYNPNHALNKKFVNYWKKVAETFKGNPYVFAYELINQPWIGNIWRDPVLVIPSMAERMKLQSVYDQLSLVIRKADEQTPLCFEPVTFDNFVPSGFSHSPGGNKFKNQSIFCYHHYQPPAINLTSLDTYVKDAKKLGISSLLSQTYGSAQTLDRAQYWKQSWMYWIYKDFGGQRKGMQKYNVAQGQDPSLDGILNGQNVKMEQNLVRTYLPRVAGELQQSKYDTASRHFTATYWATPGGQTILFLQKQRIYNNNYSINVYPQNEVTITEDGNYVTIKYDGKQPNKRILVSVSKT